jgi:hypothetical protein
VAYGFACILDEVGLHLGDINHSVRRETVRACRQLVEGIVPGREPPWAHDTPCCTEPLPT